MRLDHRQQTATVRRVAFFNHDIQYHAVFTRREIELVTVLCVAPVFDDDVGMWLKEADHLVSRSDFFAFDHAPMRLLNNAHGQSRIVFCTIHPVRALSLRRNHGVHCTQRMPHAADQLAVMGTPFLFSPGVADPP